MAKKETKEEKKARKRAEKFEAQQALSDFIEKHTSEELWRKNNGKKIGEYRYLLQAIEVKKLEQTQDETVKLAGERGEWIEKDSTLEVCYIDAIRRNPDGSRVFTVLKTQREHQLNPKHQQGQARNQARDLMGFLYHNDLGYKKEGIRMLTMSVFEAPLTFETFDFKAKSAESWKKMREFEAVCGQLGVEVLASRLEVSLNRSVATGKAYCQFHFHTITHDNRRIND
jgi:hypothetical protein